MAQKTPEVDFTRLEARVTVKPSEEKVSGEVEYYFDVLSETDSISIDAQGMDIRNVNLNNRRINFHNDGEQLWLISDFQMSTDNQLNFEYTATPKQAMYFIGWDNPPGSEYKPQVWTQGQGKENSHWLPSFDDASEKLEFDLTFVFPEDLEVISNGRLLKKEPAAEGQTRWEFDMDKPMSSYLVAVAAGEYYKKEISTSGNVPVSLYFYPGDEEKLEPTYRYTIDILDFLEKETGVAFPWQNYKQIPVRDFVYSGMENTGATIFSDIFVVDSIGFVDRNYVMVNAHEMAHQWFGNLVTAASGEHHWLQEGFATYYALLAEREIFGEDYYYWKLYGTAEQLKDLSDKGKGESIMNPKASSLTFYQKGAWALHMLKEQIGEADFKKGVKNYLENYKYSSSSIPQFIEEMEQASGQDLSGFVDQWLKQSAFPGTAALASLRKSEFINRYLSIAGLKGLPLSEKSEILSAALDFPVNDYIGQEVVHQLALKDPSRATELYKKAFESNNLLVRQAIALSMIRIPEELKAEFETFLKDESYFTKETALYRLWMNFPEERQKYLNALKGVDGFSDKNIRTLWLALNLATPQYDERDQATVYSELSGYTSTQYPYLLRENAFKYLFQLNSFSDQNLKDLLQASQYHVGQFRSFARDMIKQLLENPAYIKRFQSLIEDLPQNQKNYLEKLFSK